MAATLRTRFPAGDQLAAGVPIGARPDELMAGFDQAGRPPRDGGPDTYQPDPGVDDGRGMPRAYPPGGWGGGTPRDPGGFGGGDLCQQCLGMRTMRYATRTLYLATEGRGVWSYVR